MQWEALVLPRGPVNSITVCVSFNHDEFWSELRLKMEVEISRLWKPELLLALCSLRKSDLRVRARRTDTRRPSKLDESGKPFYLLSRRRIIRLLTLHVTAPRLYSRFRDLVFLPDQKKSQLGPAGQRELQISGIPAAVSIRRRHRWIVWQQRSFTRIQQQAVAGSSP